MAKQVELMRIREQRIGELVGRARQKSSGFRNPAIVVIGGYALRAYVPFARYSRDCDFALPKGKNWDIEKARKWFPDLSAEAEEKGDCHGYLRLIQLTPAGKRRVKIALDFMEGEIRGRGGEALLIDKKFVSQSMQLETQIGEQTIPIRVPSYQDYFLLKLLSARASDVRDIAALVWKRGVPGTGLFERAREIVSTPGGLAGKLDTVVNDVADARFLDSWRGTFITEEFTAPDKARVLAELRKLKAKAAAY